MGLFSKLFGSDQGPAKETRLGRNDPCWCGSGKKYKRCHLQSDSVIKSRQNARACNQYG